MSDLSMSMFATKADYWKARAEAAEAELRENEGVIRVWRRRAEEAEADARRYRWLAKRVLACDYGDNDTHGEKIGWRIAAKLCHGSASGSQPVVMYGASIDAAIDAELAKEPKP